MKKQLLIITTLMIASLGYSQSVGDLFTDNFIDYQVSSITPYEVKIDNYDANGGAIVNIPATVTNMGTTYSVTTIDQTSFFNKGLTSVTIPNTITTIGTAAFITNNLTSITIPNSVISIGLSSFQNNQITDLVIPSSVTNIAESAFKNNPISTINSLAMTPPTITTGGGGDTFNSDRSGIDLTIPTGTSAAYVSAQWTGFNSVTEEAPLVVGDTFIVDFITYGVTSLTPNTVQTIDYDMTGGTVVDIPAMVTYNGISYSVTQIGIDSFFNNQLTSVTIPDSVQYIINFAFGTNQLQTVTIPDGVISIGGNAFVNNQISSLTISNTVTAIGLAAFATNQLTSVTIPESVNSLAASVFNNNPLNSVISEGLTPPTITTGSGDSFNVDRSGIDLFIPSGTTGVYVTDPGALWTGFNSVTEVGSAQVGNTFTADFITYEITSLAPDTVEAIDYDMAGGTVVNIPNMVTNSTINFEVRTIGSSAFNNKNLTSVIIPNSVVSTSFQSFANNQLTSIVIPDSVTTMGNSTFQNNQLSSVSLSNNITVLGSLIFANNQLTNITIPDGVTIIADVAFFNNALTNVTIPSSVTSISGGAFINNPLTSITSESITPPSIFTGGNNDSFSDDRSGIDLIIPIGTTGPYVTDPGALWTGFNSVTEAVLSVSNFELANQIKVITTSESIKIVTNGAVRLNNYELYNISGTKVASGTESEISKSLLSGGIYILKLSLNKGTLTKKVIVN